MKGSENLKKTKICKNKRKSLILSFISRPQPYFREKSHLQTQSEILRNFQKFENFDILAHMEQL